jgi:hypothetical protein
VSDSVRNLVRVIVAAAGVTFLALVSSPGGSTERSEPKPIGTTSIAKCVGGEALPGTGSENWRSRSTKAGPVGIRKRPLSAMERQPDGSLATEMPILIEGHEKVTVAIVAGQRDRALLFYGPLAGDAAGGAPGYERIRFHPCTDQDRTVWSGGIRVEGPKAVRLKIIVADQPAFVISLGRPKVKEPAGA